MDAATSLLAALGASHISRTSDKDRQLSSKLGTVDYVLLEEGAKARPSSTKDAAPFVNTKWLKECLISGQLWEPCMYMWD